MGSLFLSQFSQRPRTVYISDPTWENHHAIFRHAGWETTTYRYYEAATNTLDLKGMLASILDAPERSIFVLHPVGHNPTGIDPTLSQWTAIAWAFQAKAHFAFFDCAYQGFVSGEFAKDRRWVVLRLAWTHFSGPSNCSWSTAFLWLSARACRRMLVCTANAWVHCISSAVMK